MKKLILGHGDKGGGGKSTLISLCVDYALTRGPVCVIEGDATIDDVAARFAGIAGVTGFGVDLSRPDASEEAVIGVFDALERAGLPAVVVVNTPASASATLDRQASVFIDAAHELGYSVRIGWMIGPDENSATLSLSSALCGLADRKIAVLNERFGDPKKFLWARHKARTAWLESGGLEAVLPPLTDTAMHAVREHMGRYTDLAKPGSGLSTITRKYVMDWARRAFEGSVAALFSDD
ncbi:MAG: hypothetical protein ACYCR3_08055 [Acidithiobacillus sp.]